MKRKSVKDYKSEGTVKTPFLAWFLDRPAVYIAVALVAILGLGSFVKTGWDSYQNAISEPEVISPYQDIQPASFKGKSWGSNLVNMKPTGVKKWEVSESNKAQGPIDPKICNRLQDTPPTILSTHVASGDGVQTRVQVYGAGQSAVQFEKYLEKMKTCFSNIEEVKVSKSNVVSFDGGFLINVGDTIIGVTSNKLDTKKLLDFYVKKAEETLKETKCLSLDSTPNDSKRSFYFNKKAYEGLSKTDNVSTNVDYANLPNPVEIKLNSVSNPNAIEPEAPLPKSFEKLPESTEKPLVPQGVAEVESFEDKATYLIADQQGPGCGWKWSSQESPVYDFEKLNKDKKAELSEVQNYVDRNAQDYITQKNNWALNVMSVMPDADNWNIFVKKTNDVHNKWSELRSERVKIQPKWYTYVANHDSWRTFDDRKAQATSEYQDAIERCELAEDDLSKWEEEWREIYEEQRERKERERKEDLEASASPSESPSATPSESPGASEEPSATPTPTETESRAPYIDIPERPQGCSTPPERPAIMDQSKPAEPKAPALSEDVTIPNSWPKPQK